jgi:hypothetical protein
MENMILMGDIKIPKEAISRQIAESVDMIVQVKRLRDGSRRTTNITEVIGMEGDVIVTQELFKFEYLDETDDGKIIGEFRSSGLRPYTLEKRASSASTRPISRRACKPATLEQRRKPVERGADRSARRNRDQPGRDHVLGDAPTHRTRPAGHAGADDASGDGVRRRHRYPEPRRREQHHRAAGGRREPLVVIDLRDPRFPWSR